MYLKTYFAQLIASCGALVLASPLCSSCYPLPVPKEQPAPSSEREMVGVFFTGNYLYWRAEEDQLVYANILSDNPAAGVPSKTKIKEQGFNWASGFRVGAGYCDPAAHWTLYADWTHYHNHTTSHARSSAGLVQATALTGIETLFLFGSKAKSKWHVDFDMVDIDLRKRVQIRRSFYLQPLIGLKGGWINQRQRISYDDFSDTDGDFTLSSATVKKKNTFSGIGPRMGLNTRWGREVGVFGQFSTALLYGHVNADLKYDLTSTPFLPSGTIKDHKNRLRPTAQLLGGFDWTHVFRKNWGFSLKAAYEVQYWWSQWQVPQNYDVVQFMSSFPQGDLTFHGLTLEGAIFF